VAKVTLKKVVGKRKTQAKVTYQTNDGKVRTYGINRKKDCIRWREEDIEQIRSIAASENRFMVDVIDEILDAGLVHLGYRTKRREN
jgi:hypothetical protein